MTPKQFIVFYEECGSVKAIAREKGVTYHAARKAYHEAKELGMIQDLRVGRKSNDETVRPQDIITGNVKAKATAKIKLPKRGQVKRFFCTCAQNNTHIHEGLYNNMVAFAKHMDAEILISRFAYQRSGLNRGGDKAYWAQSYDDQRLEDPRKETLYGSDRYVWDEKVYEHISDERIELAPGLIWCGEWQRSPTATTPLSGFEVYTGRHSSILPHVKLAMTSVPTSKGESAHFNYTTGTITMRNYIQKGAGLKAEFHHAYGFLLVEMDSDGEWFCRQVSADSDGTFYDLDLKVKDGYVYGFQKPEGLTLGDIHHERMDQRARRVTEKLIDHLKPKHIFYHDLLNFGPRNHHERDNPFNLFERHVHREESVAEEVSNTMAFLTRSAQDQRFAEHIVVDSNHDRALERWLREADWKHDPINMIFYMESVQAKLYAIKGRDNNFHMLRYWCDQFCHAMNDLPPVNVRFLHEDESFTICDDSQGGIECGMHGHLGANGARGGIRSFAKMGRKANIGHSHNAGIHEGIWQAGTSSLLDMGYNRGLSGWSHSHVLTYPNGKRAMITIKGKKYKARMV